jgi:hypothetical protein
VPIIIPPKNIAAPINADIVDVSTFLPPATIQSDRKSLKEFWLLTFLMKFLPSYL